MCLTSRGTRLRTSGSKQACKFVWEPATWQKEILAFRVLSTTLAAFFLSWFLTCMRVQEGEKYTVKVTRLADFGAFVEFPTGARTLLHISGAPARQCLWADGWLPNKPL